MSIFALPLPTCHHAQAEISWGYTAAEGAMGRRSNMGSIVAILEGGGSHHKGADLEGDPRGAHRQAMESSLVKSARRYRIWSQAMQRAGEEHRRTLEAVFRDPPLLGMEAFGTLSRLALVSDTARAEHGRARSRKRLDVWMRDLSKRTAPGRDRFGRRIEIGIARDLHTRRAIEVECEETLLASVRAWMDGARGLR